MTSEVSSLPEAGAGLALTVDPHDVEALAGAMQTVLNNAGLREKCRALAPTVSERFSASTMARQTIAVYEQAIASHVAQRSTSEQRSTPENESKIGYGSIREQQ